MKSSNDSSRENTLKANIHVHAFLANAGEYQNSPLFRPENRAKIRNILVQLTADLQGKPDTRVIDFGCGSGCLIDLMHDLFIDVHGVDITRDMLKHVDVSSGNIRLHECAAEATPFPDNHFDFATAYSFMDHLFDYRDFLVEAHRVLKPGGVFYSDLNPNRAFIQAVYIANQATQPAMTPLVRREIQGALHNGAFYEQNFGLDGKVLADAEPIKSRDNGFDAADVLSVAASVGFSRCRVEYEWFLGQAKVMHEQSMEHSAIVEKYLNSVLPVSSALFKYLRFVFVK